MIRSRRIPVAAALGLAAAITPAAAAHAATLPANSHGGVTVKASKKTLAFTFGAPAAKTYRSIAGRLVSIDCSVLDASPLGESTGDDATTEVRAPKRGRTVRTDAIQPGADFCTISKTKTRRLKNGDYRVDVGATVARVPLTAQGAAYVEELDVSLRISSVLGAAGSYAITHKNRYPAFAQLQAVFTNAKNRTPLVALPTTAATPPPGTVGYFSDGSTVSVAALARTGRRLYVELGTDNRVSTNISNYLFGDS